MPLVLLLGGRGQIPTLRKRFPDTDFFALLNIEEARHHPNAIGIIVSRDHEILEILRKQLHGHVVVVDWNRGSLPGNVTCQPTVTDAVGSIIEPDVCHFSTCC